MYLWLHRNIIYQAAKIENHSNLEFNFFFARDFECSELSSGIYCHVKLFSTEVSIMEAVRTSETSVDNHFTRQYIPEDNSEHHTRRRDKLKSHDFECFAPKLSMFL
jgi:hypothetical protein